MAIHDKTLFKKIYQTAYVIKGIAHSKSKIRNLKLQKITKKKNRKQLWAELDAALATVLPGLDGYSQFKKKTKNGTDGSGKYIYALLATGFNKSWTRPHIIDPHRELAHV